jgi:excisionase family DNA binding protein
VPLLGAERLEEVVVKYPPRTDDTNLGVRSRFATAAAAKMGELVDVTWDERHNHVRVRRHPPAAGAGAGDAALARVRQVVDLLLPESTVTAVEWGDDRELLAFKVRYRPQTVVAITEFRCKCDEVLRSLTGYQFVSWWQPEADLVSYKRRPELPARVVYPADAAAGPGIPFGVGPYGRVAEWDLTADAHALVIGKTGAGKSVVLRSLIIGATRREISVYLCDPKRISLGRGFRASAWPGVREVATDVPAMMDLIRRVHAEMMDRYARIEAGDVEPEDLPTLLLVIDECWEAVSAFNELWKTAGGKGEHPCVTDMKSLARLGRECGCRLLIGIQRPDSSLFGGTESRDNMSFRVALGQVSRYAAAMVETTEQVSSGAKGRAVVATSSDEYEAQCYFVPDPAGRLSRDERRLLEALRPEHVPDVPPLTAAPAEPVPAPRTRATPKAPPAASLPEPAAATSHLYLVKEPAEPAQPAPDTSGPEREKGASNIAAGDWLGVAEAAQLLGIDAGNVNRFARDGRIRSERKGRKYQYCRADVEQLAATIRRRTCPVCGQLGHDSRAHRS